ncbi:uncharacterized protein LOC127266706 [Andrographis paniculata]|uniref:uncharacterized protein LOC127266706 n=1 Tax=Andrographis paniculata TaxID=175694 RepID=UPI0021E92B0C|nr:uncharacterized protein LOC127266706 [Andrographis paniculata]
MNNKINNNNPPKQESAHHGSSSLVPTSIPPQENDEEASMGRDERRKPKLFLQIPPPAMSPQEFIQIKMPPTPTPTPTPKKVNFFIAPSPSDSRPNARPPAMSIRSLLPKLSFNHSCTADTDDDVEKPAVAAAADVGSSRKTSISRSWSLSKIFTPRMKRTSSLPLSPLVNSNPNNANPRMDHRQLSLHRKEVGSIHRSQSVPVLLNKEKSLQRSNSFFRVISSTPRPKDEDPEATIGDEQNDEEDIPEEEAVCRICLVELCEGGETLKMECSCKGELALAHQDCAVKWFSIKGNRTCDVCKQQVENLPVTLQRIQSSILMDSDASRTSFSQMEFNGYRVWQELPILVIVGMLAYFCFLEQLLVKKMDSNAIAISLPFSCIFGLLSSMISSTMVKRKLVWIYASVQFALVVLFAHLFYNLVHVHAIISVLLSAFAGFGVAMTGASVVVELLKWRRRVRRRSRRPENQNLQNENEVNNQMRSSDDSRDSQPQPGATI